MSPFTDVWGTGLRLGHASCNAHRPRPCPRPTVSVLLSSLTEPTDDRCDDSPDRDDDQADPVDHVIPERNSPHVLPLLLADAHLLTSMSTSCRTLVTLILRVDGWSCPFPLDGHAFIDGREKPAPCSRVRSFSGPVGRSLLGSDYVQPIVEEWLPPLAPSDARYTSTDDRRVDA